MTFFTGQGKITGEITHTHKKYCATVWCGISQIITNMLVRVFKLTTKVC